MTDRERQILAWIEENPMISQQELASLAGITRSSVAVHISRLMKQGLIQGKGYIIQKDPYMVVVGGANMDISGRPYKKLIYQDSNPGCTHLSHGGVGRNIAHNLALLGEDVKLLTAFGEDDYASMISEGCRNAGIDISYAVTIPQAKTSTYLFIADEEGDMVLAVSDMDIYQHITPELIAGKQRLIDGASVLIADTNISQESLHYLAANCPCPLFIDPVSTTKAKKLEGMLSHIHTLKPNRIEAELLSNIPINSEADLKKAADKLLEEGIQQVFISLGADGVYCADHKEHIHLKAMKQEIVNTTGAGDSFMAALAWGWKQGYSLLDQARAGMSAASICIQDEATISSKLNQETILETMKVHK